MNLIEEIELAFKNNNFDDFTKIRYIYLYVCEKFSYDSRFMYARPNLKQEIYEKELNVKNVQEFEIVCYSYAKILRDILDHFGYKSEILREKDARGSTPHAYVVAFLGNRKIKMDPTIKHDTTRVKMNAGTYEFTALTDDSTFEDDLIESDEDIKRTSTIINYAKDQNFMAMMNYISSLGAINYADQSPTQTFFNKLNAIFTIVNMRKDLKRYDDIDYYFSYILKRTRLNEKKNYVKPGIFFNVDDPSMQDIINIILVEYHDVPPTFFIMEKVNDNYRIHPATLDEVEEKLEQYSNYTIDYYFKEALRRAKLSKKKT